MFCCPKHVELNWIYQQTVVVASSWLSSLPSLLRQAPDLTEHCYLHNTPKLLVVARTLVWYDR